MSGGSNRRLRRVNPGYPTRVELMTEPGALQRNVPAGWKPVVAAGGLTVILVAAGLGAMPAGCTREAGAAGVVTGAATSKAAAAGAVVVAPIFEHGTGRATTGCEVIAPPVYVTEEEARQIIIEELGKVGVKMTQKDVEMKGVMVRPKKRGTVEVDGKWETVQQFGEAMPLVADLVDPEKGVVVEYVSEKDYRDLGGEMSMSTVQTYDFKKVGEELVEQIKGGKGANRFGVFYDPAGTAKREGLSPEEIGNKSPEELSKLSIEKMNREIEAGEKAAKEQLRLQVRDFAAWLKKQGVI